MCSRSLGKSNGIAVNEKLQSMTNFEGRLEDETHRNGVGVKDYRLISPWEDNLETFIAAKQRSFGGSGSSRLLIG